MNKPDNLITMRHITVSEGQTLMDIAVQYLGDGERVFDIMELNGLELTDEPEPGTELLVPEVAIDKVRIAEVFSSRGLMPASMEEPENEPGGIDHWAIGYDLVVQ